MPKNIVICSDGTGNSFGEQVSNVSRLVQLIMISDPDEQVAFYDQGIGTDPKHVNEVKGYKEKQREERRELTVLDPPYYPEWLPGWAARLAGLSVGYGLRRNVKELYTALAQAYHEDDGDADSIYLFGFSRGAFTVRVLAGLVYRCGLIPPTAELSSKFDRAYDLYKPHLQNNDEVKRFRQHEHVRSPRVHFLGLWDTVKSYGGIWPQSLPHLRHNPIVRNVRHALALDEQRSWFLPTSWGGIDSDPPMDDEEEYGDQTVAEIWFRGCHSDVGGGYQDGAAARIPLRWMLNEAARAGLRLNQAGRALAESSDPQCLSLHESLSCGWLVTEYLPRFELDNGYRPPKRFFKCGRAGKRQPAQFRRKHKVFLHSSVGRDHDIAADYVETIALRSPATTDKVESMIDKDHRSKGAKMYVEVLRPDKDKGPESKPVVGIRELTIDYLYADIWQRPHLSLDARRMVTIALLAVQGHEDQLRAHIRGALRSGMPVEALTELMVHVAHYGGWAAGTSGHDAVQSMRDEQAKN